MSNILCEPNVSSQERIRIIEMRNRWLGHIEEIVGRLGALEVTLDHNLDDPPYSSFVTMALILGGHREPEITTAIEALRERAGELGWTIEGPVPELGWHNVFVKAPLKRWSCPTCEGRGRWERIQPYRKEFGEFMVCHVCQQCNGWGKIEARADPANDVCWIKYSAMARQFVPAEWIGTVLA